MAASEIAHAQAFQSPVAVSPASLDLDPEPEHYLGPEHSLHIHPGFLTDTAQALALVANDDFLLAFPFDQNQCRNMQGFALVLELFNLHRYGIRQFSAELASDFLPHHFGRHKAFTAMGNLIIRVKVNTLGQKAAKIGRASGRESGTS